MLRNFVKFTRNTCARVSFLISCWLWRRCFPVNFAKFLKRLFFMEHLWWLLLNMHHWKRIKMKFLNKKLSKAIMIRAKLKNIHINFLGKTIKIMFRKFEYLWYFVNKKFWRTIKPLFRNKKINPNKLLLVDKGDLVSNEIVLANLFNNFFISITLHLGLKTTSRLNVDLLKI